jgi:predicted lysophospholipase L1 biosynthesis ABC-type transport system permease subunit
MVIHTIGPSEVRLLAMIRNLTQVVVVASLIIAACSLALNIAAGLSERKRPFSLLRLTGVPTAVLRRVVALESALPLFLVAIVPIVVGRLAAALFLKSQLDFAFRMPGKAYWATVICGLAASLAIFASTFPLLSRMTGPEVARNERAA